MTVNKTEEAYAVLERVARSNGKTMPPGKLVEHVKTPVGEMIVIFEDYKMRVEERRFRRLWRRRENKKSVRRRALQHNASSLVHLGDKRFLLLRRRPLHYRHFSEVKLI